MQKDVIRTQKVMSTREAGEARILSYTNGVLKRFFDILFSFIGMILFMPVFVSIAVAIKRNSPGKVIYKGPWMGKDEQLFYIYKFRTMHSPVTEGKNGPPITASTDPRVTSLGKYLRDTKLNELPQLWNVFKGDMSFVGPRPEDYEIALTWPVEVRQEIHSIRPGITSPASIVYRNEEELLQGDGFMDDYLGKILPDKIRLDQLYIRNHTLLTDIDLLAATVVMLLPLMRGKKVDERWLFGGPVVMLFRRVFSWFLLDVIVTTISVGVSGLVWRLSTVINLGVPVFIVLALAIAVIIGLINMLMGLQKVSWRDASPAYVLDIAFSVGLTMTILWLINRFWFTDPWIPFSLFWLIGITTYLGLVGVRYRDRLITSLAYRWLLFRGTDAIFAERILIVGAGHLGELTSWLIQRSTYSTLFGVIGFVDDDPKKRNLHIGGLKILGSTDHIPRLVEKYSVGMIMMAISDADPAELNRIKQICASTGAKVIVMPDLVKRLEEAFEGIVPNGN